MSHLKFGSLILAAIIAVSVSGAAAATTSASVFTLSTEECNGASFWNLCYEKASKYFELTGTQSTEVDDLAEILIVEKKIIVEPLPINFRVPELGVTIKCGDLIGPFATTKQSAPLAETGTLQIKGLLFEQCKLEGELGGKCEIPIQKESEELTGKVTSATEMRLTPTSGKSLIKLEFKNKGAEKCPATVLGTREVTGEQILTIEKAGTGESVKEGRTLIKSGLKLSGKTAELESSLVISYPSLEDLVAIKLS